MAARETYPKTHATNRLKRGPLNPGSPQKMAAQTAIPQSPVHAVRIHTFYSKFSSNA